MPVPVAPVGSVPVANGVDLIDGDDGGAVFLWGMAAWCWGGSDEEGRRLAAVQLLVTGAAKPGPVAVAFGVSQPTLWRWRDGFVSKGVLGLVSAKPGPRGPSKLTEDKVAEIAGLRSEGLSRDEIAAREGVSTGTVSRAFKMSGVTKADAPVPVSGPESPEDSGLVPLARPEPRDAERQAARRGELVEAAPVITEGAQLPLAGALVILPALAATGLVDAFESVFAPVKAAFYGLRSLVLTMVFAALVGEARVEGLTRINPVDLGRLLGLDRAPEPRQMRARMAALADQHQAAQLLETLARHHIEANEAATGVFYVDGHVRAYHGKADVAKAHVARIRLSMPAEVDTWIADGRGDGVLVWQAEPGASLTGELRRVATKIRALIGPDKRPSIIFDRGGWSPALFAELDTLGFDIATYRKKPCRAEPRSHFHEHDFIDDLGRRQHYWLADRQVRLTYDKGKRRFPCRQITRLDIDTGHQTQIITTRTDTDPAPLAYAMFSRWRQENFFRYMRQHYGLDGLDAYDIVADDPERLVPNPAKKDAARDVAEFNAIIEAAEAADRRAQQGGTRTATERKELDTAFDHARSLVDRLKAVNRTIPARTPLADTHPDAARLNDERKRIHDAIRMATYNAETALARLLAPHYPRAHHEARSLLHEIFTTPADLHIHNGQLHVTIAPLSAPRRTRALTNLCHDLTATQTTYPGTNLTLTYTVHNHA